MMRRKIYYSQKDTDCETEFIKLKKKRNSVFFEEIEKLIDYHDFPISTISYYVHSKISERAKKSGFKVIFIWNRRRRNFYRIL